MSWFKPKPNHQYFDIPEDKIRIFWNLFDDYRETKSKSAKHKLWSFICELFPVVKGIPCEIDDSSIMNPRIKMKIN